MSSPFRDRVLMKRTLAVLALLVLSLAFTGWLAISIVVVAAAIWARAYWQHWHRPATLAARSPSRTERP